MHLFIMNIIHTIARARRRSTSLHVRFPIHTKKVSIRVPDETRRDSTHPDRSTTVDDDDAPDAVVREGVHDAFEFVVRLRRRTPTERVARQSVSREKFIARKS